MPHGKLEVYVEGAVDIKDTNMLGKGSPYCTLTMSSQEFSSPPIAEGGTRPFFNTNFEFQVDRSSEQMMVKIFSKKSLTDDDLLGYCTIVFKDAFYHSHVVPVTAYALTRPSGRPGGHIRLSLTFKARPRSAVPPAGAYMAPPPRPAGPYRQPRPPPPVGGVGRGGPRPYSEDPSYRRQSHPIDSPNSPSRPKYVPRIAEGRPHAGGDLPRRLNEEDSSSQSSESSHLDDDTPPAPHGAPYQQPVRRPGPPPGPNPADWGKKMPRQAPPNKSSSYLQNAFGGAFGGALMQNVGGSLGAAVGAIMNLDGEGSDWGGGALGEAVGAILNPDGEGSDWGGGGDDEGSIGQIETASYGSGRSGSAVEEVGYYEGGSSSGAVEEADYYDDGETSQDAVGAPGYGAAYNPGPRQPRGRGGPVVRGRAVPRGRAGPPPVRGRAVPRGRAGPPGGRAGPPVRRGGVPIRGVVRGRGPPRGGASPSMARGGPPPM